MSAILKIRKEAVWFPSIGVFEWGTERIKEALSDQTAIIEILTPPTESVYIDLSSLDRVSFATLFRATSQAEEKALGEISTIEGKSAAYFAIDLHALCQLKMLIRTDQRIGASSGIATLTLAQEVRWNAPDWLYDIILKSLALRAVLKDKESFHLIIDSWVAGNDDCDLSSLDSQKFNILVAAFADVVQYYGEGKAFGFRAPELAQIADEVNYLSALLKADPRTNCSSSTEF